MAVRSGEGETLRVIEAEGLKLFFLQGYHGTSVREIAAASGIALATMFHHFRTKEDILATVLAREHQKTITSLEAARDGAEGPLAQWTAVIHSFALSHMERQMETFVADTETRSLSETNAPRVQEQRRQLQQLFDDLITRGAETGVFHVDRPRDASRAIVTMVVAIARWYKPDGTMAPEQVADQYVRFSLRILGASDA